MAESSFDWISVVVKQGSSTILPRKIVTIGWDSNFGELLAAVDPTLANDTINKVCISGKDSYLDPVHELDVTAPLSLCNTLNCLFVCFHLKDKETTPTVAGILGGWEGGGD